MHLPKTHIDCVSHRTPSSGLFVSLIHGQSTNSLDVAKTIEGINTSADTFALHIFAPKIPNSIFGWNEQPNNTHPLPKKRRTFCKLTYPLPRHFWRWFSFSFPKENSFPTTNSSGVKRTLSFRECNIYIYVYLESNWPIFWKIWPIKCEVGHPPKKEVSLVLGIHTVNLKHPLQSGCFNLMIPNLYMKNGCFTKHPLKQWLFGVPGIKYTIWYGSNFPLLMPWYPLPGNVGWQDLTSTAGVAASFVGTANYMSPERALGKDGETRNAGGRATNEHLKMPGVVCFETSGKWVVFHLWG